MTSLNLNYIIIYPSNFYGNQYQKKNVDVVNNKYVKSHVCSNV
jgi:hypothetical protein